MLPLFIVLDLYLRLKVRDVKIEPKFLVDYTFFIIFIRLP